MYWSIDWWPPFGRLIDWLTRVTFNSSFIQFIGRRFPNFWRGYCFLLFADSADIVDGRLKLILGLVWALILHYSISRALPKGEGEEEDFKKDKRTPKERLLSWFSEKLPLPVKNFTTDWNDGRACGALDNVVAPGQRMLHPITRLVFFCIFGTFLVHFVHQAFFCGFWMMFCFVFRTLPGLGELGSQRRSTVLSSFFLLRIWQFCCTWTTSCALSHFDLCVSFEGMRRRPWTWRRNGWACPNWFVRKTWSIPTWYVHVILSVGMWYTEAEYAQ